MKRRVAAAWVNFQGNANPAVIRDSYNVIVLLIMALLVYGLLILLAIWQMVTIAHKSHSIMPPPLLGMWDQALALQMFLTFEYLLPEMVETFITQR